MKSRTWLICWGAIVIVILIVIGIEVYRIDPFFHYHKPDIANYYYTIDNERSQNDGIIKHFDYDAIITGTSMTENFKTSLMDELFNTCSIKVPFQGATNNEINDNLKNAFEKNPEIKVVVRGLDSIMLFYDKDVLREDMGEYSTYLYDNNPFNDVKYIYNKDVIFGRVYPMLGSEPGFTSFDEYANWSEQYSYGINSVAPDGVVTSDTIADIHLSDEEIEMIRGNVLQNITDLADQHPNTEFYYFITPYSVVWWSDMINNGLFYKHIEAQKLAMELIVEHENIHLFCFNNRIDITSDLNNYKDASHYGPWINDFMLERMKDLDEDYLITKDNYADYIYEMQSIYSGFDYGSLNSQTDYEDDKDAVKLFN